MKKNLLMLAVVLLTALLANAETSQSVCATLNHEGTVTTFMGGNGLKEAHAAAADGDAIILSPGTFNAVDITKAITLRGAGAPSLTLPGDIIKPAAGTYITGNMTFNIASTEGKLTIEGCDFTDHVSFRKAPATDVFKTRIATVGQLTNDVASINFVHCLLYVSASGINDNTSMLNTAAYYDYFNPAVNATNCVLIANLYNTFSYNGSTPGGGKLLNCIFLIPTFSSYSIQPLSANCVAYNSIACSKADNNYPSYVNSFFRYCSNGTNRTYVNLTMFNAEDKLPGYPFIMTEEAQQTYLGDDGTQVGIHGGALPIDPIPDNLLVTKCSIAPKTTASGKLAIEIQVSTAK